MAAECKNYLHATCSHRKGLASSQCCHREAGLAAVAIHASARDCFVSRGCGLLAMTPDFVKARGLRPADLAKTSRLTPPRPPGEPDPLFATTMKPTFRPHRKKRARKIGVRARKATRGGRKVLAARRR